MLKETVEWCKPTRATKYSAMVDLYAKEDVVIGAGETKIVNLGVKIDLNGVNKSAIDYINPFINPNFFGDYIEKFMKSHFISLHPRSSLRAKGLIVGVGVVDLDFPNELGLIVHNPITIDMFEYSQRDVQAVDFAPTNYAIKKGDKIAQCTLMEHKGFLMGIESDVERSGGFGSTDKEKL